MLTLVCVGVFSFLSGGFILARSAPMAMIYLLAAAVWVWFARRRSRLSRLYLVALGSFGLFVAWTGLSVLWSFGPHLSWVAFDVAALYLAVMAVVGLTPAGGLQLRTTGYGYFVVAVAAAAYAFCGKAVPDVVTHAHTWARLNSPVGYWNVLALMMVMGLVVGLSLASDRGAHPAWRVLAAAGSVPLCLTFFFTLSRGGWIALAVALAVYFSLSPARLASFTSLVVIVAPVAAALWSVRGLGTLVRATTDDALRAAEGHALLRWALLALVVTAAAQLLVALAHRGVPWPRWLRLAAGVAIAVVLVGGVSLGSWRFIEARGGAAWVSERVHTFIAGDDETSSGEGTTRLVSLNAGRLPLWRVALLQSRSARALGTGAGTFVLSHERFRVTEDVVKHAHSQWFNVLSELGVVGLGLFTTAVGLLVAAAVRNPFRDRRDPLRPLLVALQAGVVAFVVHISWDWDWDMAAIGVVFVLFAATCSSYLATRAARDAVPDPPGAGDRSSATTVDVEAVDDPAAAGSDASPPGAPATGRRPAGWALRAAASSALVLLAVGWLLPYAATRAEGAAMTAAADGDVVMALTEIRRAARYAPLSADILVTESLMLQQLGRNSEALGVLRRAQRLQPDDYEPYYQEGVLQLTAFGDRRAAVAALKRALALNPLDSASRYELEVALRP